MTEQAQQGEQKAGRQCICEDLSAAISEIFRKFGPPQAAREHFTQARMEVLKGIRVIIDQRIQDLSHAQARGSKVTVE